MDRLTANGIELTFESFGDETAEAILLIAGLGSQLIRWPVRLCQDLAKCGYRVIRFDNRDAGCSTHFNGYPAPDFDSLVALLYNRGERTHCQHRPLSDTLVFR